MRKKWFIVLIFIAALVLFFAFFVDKNHGEVCIGYNKKVVSTDPWEPGQWYECYGYTFKLPCCGLVVPENVIPYNGNE